MKTALTLRFVMIGLSLVLGVALVAQGSTLIGVILIALAFVRAAMVFSRLRRRARRPLLGVGPGSAGGAGAGDRARPYRRRDRWGS